MNIGYIVGITLAIFFAIGITAKSCWLVYVFLVRRESFPKDLSGPVSGWGTPDG